MSQFPNRAALWLNKLAPDAPLMVPVPSVRVADGLDHRRKTCVLSPWSRMLTTTHRAPPAAKSACWKAGRWAKKWLMKPLPPTRLKPVIARIVAVIDAAVPGLWPPRRNFRHSRALAGGGWRLCQSRLGWPPGNGSDRRRKAMSGAIWPTATGQPPDRL